MGFLAAALLLTLVPPLAAADVEREVLAAGPFGDVGAYERATGTLLFAWDPAAPAHARIVDLERAAQARDEDHPRPGALTPSTAHRRGGMRYLLSLLALCACAPTGAPAPAVPVGELVLAPPDGPGTPLVLDVRLVDGQGRALAGVTVALDQDDGLWREHPDRTRLSGLISSDARGGAVFYTVLPSDPARITIDGRLQLSVVFDRDATIAGQRSISLVQDEAGILYGSTVVEL